MITLVLGGTRSGKSEYAERLATLAAGEAGRVTYVATGTATDPDMAARIALHQGRRPAEWATAEVGTDLVRRLAAIEGVAIVDSLGTWVAACRDLTPDTAGLCEVLRDRTSPTILVSEEVGLGVHAATEAGRRFADALGELNRAVADVAATALFVIAGRALPLVHVDDLRMVLGDGHAAGFPDRASARPRTSTPPAVSPPSAAPPGSPSSPLPPSSPTSPSAAGHPAAEPSTPPASPGSPSSAGHPGSPSSPASPGSPSSAGHPGSPSSPLPPSSPTSPSAAGHPAAESPMPQASPASPASAESPAAEPPKPPGPPGSPPSPAAPRSPRPPSATTDGW